ncbi:hypothetical protein NDU88_002797 [Pleurodeles waltl]|uniref:Uncharacterized protein n=1 Tax=Pleurodeles waltl TaxID=8319 RepID=A0AAV7RB08_PLEWA|nr:hypothetical protein NDU88_002797 [Pleurodeles waltl]
MKPRKQIMNNDTTTASSMFEIAEIPDIMTIHGLLNENSLSPHVAHEVIQDPDEGLATQEVSDSETRVDMFNELRSYVTTQQRDTLHEIGFTTDDPVGSDPKP